MVGRDFEYIQKLLDLGVIRSPVLDLGVGGAGEAHNCKKLVENAKLSYFGTDICDGNDVDIIANFEDSTDVKNKFKEKFGSILILNVLEHTFDPIRILDNAFTILKPGGVCVIITPTVWPLHDFPIDCFRVNPNFYEEYCKRRSLVLMEDYFEYVGFHNVRSNMDNNSYVLPQPAGQDMKYSVYSKAIHKLFNTYGRSMSCASHIAVGAVIRLGDENCA